MSDRPEGPGWWIASDEKWYPPELHPSVRNSPASVRNSPVGGHASPDGAAGDGTEGAEGHRGGDPRAHSTRVGPQFPDLFQKAIEGSYLADNVSVHYDGEDERNTTSPTSDTRSPMRAATRTGPSRGSAPVEVGAFTGATATKRRWRRGH